MKTVFFYKVNESTGQVLTEMTCGIMQVPQYLLLIRHALDLIEANYLDKLVLATQQSTSKGD